jgi:hypothetical protein
MRRAMLSRGAVTPGSVLQNRALLPPQPPPGGPNG